ncbi:GreA/GreB family elongation factor [Fusibacter bizertensis]
MSGGDLLKRHLAWIEQDKLEVSEKLFGFDYQEKQQYESFVESYVKKICDIYGDTVLDENDLPFVAITSHVTVIDEAEGERLTFKIISPNDSDSVVAQLDDDVIGASYLSIVGKAMLLKGKNERVEVHTPQGGLCYRIEKISM